MGAGGQATDGNGRHPKHLASPPQSYKQPMAWWERRWGGQQHSALATLARLLEIRSTREELGPGEERNGLGRKVELEATSEENPGWLLTLGFL